MISSDLVIDHAAVPSQSPKAKVQRPDISDDDFNMDAG